MRFIFFLFFSALIFSACKKDKFTTEPQIKFIKFSPNQGNNLPSSPQPYVIFKVTDADGDLDVDSAKIVIRNTFTNQIDSTLRFPNLRSAAGKDFEGEVQVGLKSVLGGRDITPGNPAPFVDTIGFEIYVVDKGKHKSNVIVASPFYFFSL